MTRKVYLAAVGALILVLSLNWWLRESPVREAPDAVPDPRFDYALTEFTARFHAEDGRLQLEVTGPRLEHSGETRQARIREPRFVIEPDGANWTGRSETGILEREDDQLILIGNVVLIHPHPDGAVRVDSQEIWFHHDLRMAHSPGPGRISRAGTELSGGTLSLWFDDQRMELKDNVQAVFDTAGSGDAVPGTSDH